MNPKTGCLRRIVILFAFAWVWHHLFVASDDLVHDPATRQFLGFALLAAVIWAIVTLYAQRIRTPQTTEKEHEHEEHTRRN